MMRNCERATKIDYGLQMQPNTILEIAYAEEFQWLLQPELKAIKEELTFVLDKDFFGRNYTGYLNARGQR
jgi:hypothetical protein